MVILYLIFALILTVFCYMQLEGNVPSFIVYRFCLVFFTLPDPEYQGMFWLVILFGECDEYSFGPEELKYFEDKVVRPEYVSPEFLEALANDKDLQYKVVQTTYWKDDRIFRVIKVNEEGPWDIWLNKLREEYKPK